MSAVAERQQTAVGMRHAESRPDAAAVQAVIGAIHAGAYPANGVTFEPFRLKCVAGAFDNIWNSDRGDTPITFFRSNGSGGAYLPLGDIVVIGTSYNAGQPAVAPGTQLLFAPDTDATVLAHPTGFAYILDDHGSGNHRDIDYLSMIPPAGYTALGIVFSSGDTPDVNKFWCVRNDLVRAVAASHVWSDRNSAWSHNGDLNVPVLNLQPPAEPTMLFAPPTFLSMEGGTAAYAIVMRQADLPITPIEPTFPAYDPTITSGDETAYGLTSVKIVPYTAVTDPGVVDQSTTSPFYFVAAEPYWLCTKSLPTPKGGLFEATVTVGTAQSQSDSFTSETSMTVSAEVGVEYGGVSAKASASYTKAFSTTAEHSEDHRTEVQQKIVLNLPAQPRTWFWERQTQIAVFRSDLTQLTPAAYSGKDLVFIPEGKR